MESKRFTINRDELKSIAVTIVITGVSAAITEALQLLPQVNFGENSVLVVTVLVIVLKALQKFLQGGK